MGDFDYVVLMMLTQQEEIARFDRCLGALRSPYACERTLIRFQRRIADCLRSLQVCLFLFRAKRLIGHYR